MVSECDAGYLRPFSRHFLQTPVLRQRRNEEASPFAAWAAAERASAPDDFPTTASAAPAVIFAGRRRRTSEWCRERAIFEANRNSSALTSTES